MKSIAAAQEFEDLVAELLVANGFELVPGPLPSQWKRTPDQPVDAVDIVAQYRGNTWGIEVKYYRTARAQLQLVRTAANVLVAQLKRGQVQRGMLVVSSVLDAELREELEREFGIRISGRDELLGWAVKAAHLIDRLNSILEADPTATRQYTARSIEDIEAPIAPAVLEQPPPDTPGTDLCRELRALPARVAEWRAYEHVCERILKYLFANDLHGWHRQRRTDDGLNRCDLICRVKPTTDFWQFLIQHVGTRYILFEFKNYSHRIKQGQVLTTEKYLLEKGLRRTGIMLTRRGSDKGADAMAKGAMREHGKLLLVLDDEQVCEMLHMRERGEDPSDLLFATADDFLLSLSR